MTSTFRPFNEMRNFSSHKQLASSRFKSNKCFKKWEITFKYVFHFKGFTFLSFRFFTFHLNLERLLLPIAESAAKLVHPGWYIKQFSYLIWRWRCVMNNSGLRDSRQFCLWLSRKVCKMLSRRCVENIQSAYSTDLVSSFNLRHG